MAGISQIAQIDSSTNQPTAQKSTAGAANVMTDLAQGIVYGKRVKAFHIREQDALAGSNVTFDWSATPVAAVVLIPTQEAAGTAQLNASIAYCIDPPSAAVRDAWLTAGTNLTGDTNAFSLPVGTIETLTFSGNNISYLGAVREFGSENIRLRAVGVEVYP